MVWCRYRPKLRNFKPAKVTKIDDTLVSGASGSGSPCPACTIELFLDDTDNIIEAWQSLAVVTAGQDGNWTATLPAPLQANQGLRTMSTVPDEWAISGLDGGTTSNLSALYVKGYRVFVPLILKVQ